jgi:hypothetical protein
METGSKTLAVRLQCCQSHDTTQNPNDASARPNATVTNKTE